MLDYKISGKIVKGGGWASRTIESQKPFFNKIPDINNMHSGTINLDINPIFIKPLQFDYFFDSIKWCSDCEESFGFNEIKINYKDKEYNGYLYFPSNSLHFVNKYFYNYLEIVCEKIPDCYEGAKLTFLVNKSRYDVYRKI